MTAEEDNDIDEINGFLGEYKLFLSGKAKGTTDAYLRTVRHLIGWITQRPDNDGHFQAQQLTKTAVEMYLTHLDQEGLSINHRACVKSTISNFAYFLMEEKRLLQRNPTRRIDLSPQPVLTPQLISKERRPILLSSVESDADLRGDALVASGYWAA